MSTYVGGLRYRLVVDSVYETVRASLAALGWFDAGRQHAPINLRPEPVDWDEEVPPNTIAVSASISSSEPAEMGSNLEDETHAFYADVFAENDSLGRHLAHDLRDILRGKFPSIGRGRPSVQVFDMTVDPPVPLFYVDIDNVVADKAVAAAHPWQRHWWAVRFDVLDSYGDEDDA